MKSITIYAFAALRFLGTACAQPDYLYQGAVERNFLPAAFMLDRFESMGFAPNRTVPDDDGSMFELFEFDLDSHSAMHDQMIFDIIAQGPQNKTHSGSESTDIVPRQSGDEDSFSCKVANSFVYSYSLNLAGGAACGLIFQGATKLGVTYAKKKAGVSTTTGAKVDVIYKYVWFLPGFGSSTACSTLISKIVSDNCYVSYLGTYLPQKEDRLTGSLRNR